MEAKAKEFRKKCEEKGFREETIDKLISEDIISEEDLIDFKDDVEELATTRGEVRRLKRWIRDEEEGQAEVKKQKLEEKAKTIAKRNEAAIYSLNKKELKKLHKQIQSCTKQKDTYKQAVIQLAIAMGVSVDQAVSNLTAARKLFKSSLDTITTQLDNLRKEDENKHLQINQLKVQMQTLDVQKAQKEKESADIQKRVSQAESSYSEAVDQCRYYENLLRKKRQEKAELEDKVESKEEDLKIVAWIPVVNIIAVPILLKQLSSLKDEIRDINSSLSKYRHLAERATTERDRLTSSLSKLNKELKGLVKDICLNRKKVRELKKERHEQRIKLSQCSEKLRKVRSGHTFVNTMFNECNSASQMATKLAQNPYYLPDGLRESYFDIIKQLKQGENVADLTECLGLTAGFICP